MGSSWLASRICANAAALSPRMAACLPFCARSRARRRCTSVGVGGVGTGAHDGRAGAGGGVRFSAYVFSSLSARNSGQQQGSANQQGGLQTHNVTVTVTLPLLPSLVAVIETFPFFFPVTTPDCDTVAVVLLADDQMIARPVSTFPFASFNVAVSVTVAFSATLGAVGAMVTVATGA